MTRAQRGMIRLLAGLALIGVIAIGIIAGNDHLWLICMALAVPFTAVALWRGAPRDEPLFNRTAQKLAHILLTLFVLLSMQLVRAQVVTSGATQIRTEDTPLGVVRNPRLLDAQLQAIRGEVYTSDGVKIVGRDVQPDKSVRRTYLNPVADYLVGYYNPGRYGTSNLEFAYNTALSGRTDADPAKSLEWSLLHQPAQGNDLILTLNAALQQQATNLLGNRKGSIVLLDARTGAVIAMVSNPHLDPAGLAQAPGNDPAAYWNALRNDPNSPFVLRPTQGLYTPGSIFKTVTAAAAIDAGKARLDTPYEDRGFYNIEGFHLQEQNIPKGRESQQSWTLEEGYQWSLNVVFAQVGAQTLGGPLLNEYARRFGFGEQIPFDLGTNASRVSDRPDFLQSGAAVAETAFGQGQLLATPLQMALVAACMANDGKEMEPYLVAAVRRPDGTIASEHAPKVWKQPIRAETAVQMRAMMENSVANGYANGAAIPGVKSGGKTGTAEVPNAPPHAWYIGYAPGKTTTYAIAVLIENGGEGSTVAAPIAKQMLQAALTYDAKK
ncbi:MAG: penicillin-binding transpeptidase domain-containing protein [Thermomicrobiales bacterium]